jgi:TDG/mug DNA glycosylase family protein
MSMTHYYLLTTFGILQQSLQDGTGGQVQLTGGELRMEELKPVPDYLQEGLTVLFVGFNPSIRSAETGHHYANPNNRFWNILYQAGLTPRKYTPEEDHLLLKLGYGLTNIVERPTPGAVDITREEYAAGREALSRKIVRYRPRVVCYVGKGVYEEYRKRVSYRTEKTGRVSWGVQETPVIPGIVDFVAPSSSGLVRMGMDQVVAIYRQLAELISPAR